MDRKAMQFMKDNGGIKDFMLRVRLNMQEKEQFYAICKRNDLVPSKVVREFIHNVCTGQVQL